MNIKGKHLLLCRFIRDNYAVTIGEAQAQGFEFSMINSLAYNKDESKQVISIHDYRLYLPSETQARI